MPIEAVIYDMDGVLVDSEPYWKRSRVEFAADLGKVWTDADQRACMGRNTIEWAHTMHERLDPPMSVEEIIEDMLRRMALKYEENLPLRPGALESVRAMAAAYPVALASGSPTLLISHVMRLTGLDKVFRAMVYGDDIPNGKPAPDIYLEAARRLDVPPERCLGIEDSGNGVRALHNAGMFIVAAPTTDFPLPPDLLALAQATITSLEAFTPALVASLSK